MACAPRYICLLLALFSAQVLFSQNNSSFLSPRPLINAGQARAATGGEVSLTLKGKSGKGTSLQPGKKIGASELQKNIVAANTNTGKLEGLDKRGVAVKGKKQVSIHVESVHVSEYLRVSIPKHWEGKEVVTDIYTAKGEIIRKITDKQAAQDQHAEFFDLPAAGYLVILTCGDEFALQQVIRTGSL